MKLAKSLEELKSWPNEKKYQLPDGNWVDGSFSVKKGSVVWDSDAQTYRIIFGLSGGNYIQNNAWSRPIEEYPPLGVYYSDGKGLAPGYFSGSYCMNSHKRGYRVIEGPILKKVEELLEKTYAEAARIHRVK